MRPRWKCLEFSRSLGQPPQISREGPGSLCTPTPPSHDLRAPASEITGLLAMAAPSTPRRSKARRFDRPPLRMTPDSRTCPAAESRDRRAVRVAHATQSARLLSGHRVQGRAVTTGVRRRNHREVVAAPARSSDANQSKEAAVILSTPFRQSPVAFSGCPSFAATTTSMTAGVPCVGPASGGPRLKMH